MPLRTFYEHIARVSSFDGVMVDARHTNQRQQSTVDVNACSCAWTGYFTIDAIETIFFRECTLHCVLPQRGTRPAKRASTTFRWIVLPHSSQYVQALRADADKNAIMGNVFVEILQRK